MKLKKLLALTAAVFLGSCILSGCCCHAKCDPKKEVKKVSRSVVIDVRSAREYKAGHLRNALHIPLDVIGKKISKAVPDKNTPIYLYCRSGRRSSIALKILEKMQYKNLYNAGGLKEAQKLLSLPIVK